MTLKSAIVLSKNNKLRFTKNMITYDKKALKPLVSVITPAFNCEKTIIETYNSIKNQTCSSWEWIVVDDCSKDNTFKTIKKLCETDDRIKLFVTEQNGGAATARNIGIEKAQGRYISFLDSDDVFKPDKLEQQINFMKEANCAFSFTDYDILYSNGKTRQKKSKRLVVDYNYLLKTNCIGCLTVMYDVQKIGKCFMPLDCEKREDHGAWLDITKKGVNAYKINKSLSVYRISNTSVSHNKASMIKYQYRLYRQHEGFSFLKSLWYLFMCILHKLVGR